MAKAAGPGRSSPTTALEKGVTREFEADCHDSRTARSWATRRWSCSCVVDGEFALNDLQVDVKARRN